MFKKKNPNEAKERLQEEELYGIAYAEIANNEMKYGVWAKALVQAKGDNSKAKAIYIELRLQSIIDEIAVAQETLEFENKKQKEEMVILERKRAAKNAENERKEFLAKEWVTIDEYMRFNPKTDRAAVINLAIKSQITTKKGHDGYMLIKPHLTL